MSLPTPSSSAGPSKVAIPRLLQRRPEPPRKATISRANRADRACLSCRARKIKCNAARPRCSNCTENTTSCVYVSSRKDRLRTATGQNQDMVALLRDLRDHVSDGSKSRIDDMLVSVVDDIADAAASVRDSHGQHDEVEATQENEQEDSNMRTRFGDATDLSSRKMPFTSRAEAAAAHGQPDVSKHWQETLPSKSAHVNKTSFFLDDLSLETDPDVDPFELPSFEVAEKLLQAYMTSCHNSFPLLAKKGFTHQFYHYYAALQGGEPYIPSHTWHTQLQIVLAIGAHYSLLTSGSKQEDGCAHSIYHSRAWALSLKSCWWALKPDLPQMQVAGLLSFYYLSIGSINRSWTFIGIALRIGYALGLHTHNDVASSAVTKEVLSRIWWGHFSLDTMLAAMTGRPSVQLYTTYPVPLPLPVSSTEIEETIIESRFGNRKTNPEGLYARTPPSSFTETVRSSAQTMSNYSAYELEPTNSGSYLKHVVQLGKITNDTLKLYTEKTDESWQGIQETIVRLVEELDLWATSLPEGLDFDKREADTGQKYEREKHALEILFHGTKILITRPCLCRLDRHTMTQSARLSEFNESMALTCLESAKMVARLLPNRPEVDVVLLYETTSWWNIVHVIMQSLVVLLLEMSCEANYSPHDGHEMLPSMKKLVRWLRALRANNAMAQRAYPHIMDFLRASVCKIKTDVSDLIQEDDQAHAAASSAAGKKSSFHETHHATTSPSVPSPNTSLSSVHGPPHFTAVNHPTSHVLISGARSINSQEASHFAGEYASLHTESYSFSKTTFPTLFFTTFDEQNPLPGFGLTKSDYAVGGRESMA